VTRDDRDKDAQGRGAVKPPTATYAAQENRVDVKHGQADQIHQSADMTARGILVRLPQFLQRICITTTALAPTYYSRAQRSRSRPGQKHIFLRRCRTTWRLLRCTSTNQVLLVKTTRSTYRASRSAAPRDIAQGFCGPAESSRPAHPLCGAPAHGSAVAVPGMPREYPAAIESGCSDTIHFLLPWRLRARIWTFTDTCDNG
jgi:hypothetical protein